MIVPKLGRLNDKCMREQTTMDLEKQGINSWIIEALISAAFIVHMKPIIHSVVEETFTESVMSAIKSADSVDYEHKDEVGRS